MTRRCWNGVFFVLPAVDYDCYRSSWVSFWAVFPLRFSLYLHLQDLEMGPCFLFSSHGFERSCYFRAKSLAKHQVLVVFWGSMCLWVWQMCIFWNSFCSFGCGWVRLTRAGLLGNILSLNLGRRRIVGDIFVVFLILLVRRERVHRLPLHLLYIM